MPHVRVDRDNGYARFVSSLPTLAEINKRSKELRGKIKFGLTEEEATRRTRPSNPELFKRTYGISVYEYEEMFFAQGGKCAICKREETNGRLLATDHCHQTGKVRGLLCGMCNKGLGSFRDNIPNLIAALEYLRSA